MTKTKRFFEGKKGEGVKNLVDYFSYCEMKWRVNRCDNKLSKRNRMCYVEYNLCIMDVSPFVYFPRRPRNAVTTSVLSGSYVPFFFMPLLRLLLNASNDLSYA